MELGGPVWHASVSSPSLNVNVLRLLAEKVLDGVGSQIAGEWHQWTGKAYHIRRRLTLEEMNVTGPIMDIRGTPEAVLRLAPVRHIVPPEIYDEETRSIIIA